MTGLGPFRLVHSAARRLAIDAVVHAENGMVVTIRKPKRSLDQNAIFHAICDDIAKSKIEWFGRERSAEEWKVLLVSAHAAATGRGCEMVQGLEGELVQVRESTAAMSVSRSSSLIEYAVAWATQHGITLRDHTKGREVR